MPIPALGLGAGIATALAFIAPGLVIKVLSAIGFATVTYLAVDVLLDNIYDLLRSNIGSAGTYALGVIRLLKIDTCLNIVFSAITARLIFAGLTAAGTFTKTTWKSGGFTP